ncbi:hypothetical protein [Acrocarpospora catenulata]|uniref:hypothetical protein n=1 Tax=Acrocarpospora catenulata TaxID=2836182 RepID=UPI001BDA3724|nr:hypothetical protein [Acrocarpospora catenulata]
MNALSAVGALILTSTFVVTPAHAESKTFHYRDASASSWITINDPSGRRCYDLQGDASLIRNKTDYKAMLYRGSSCSGGMHATLIPGERWVGRQMTVKSVRFMPS